MKMLIAVAVTAAAFLVLDMIWLGLVARDFYKSQLGPLMADQFNLTAAAAFYVIMLVGVIVFVVNPAIASGSVLHALGYGALFGLVAYATYDMTNLATTRNWPAALAYTDMAWGSALTAMASAAGTWAALRFG